MPMQRESKLKKYMRENNIDVHELATKVMELGPIPKKGGAAYLGLPERFWLAHFIDLFSGYHYLIFEVDDDWGIIGIDKDPYRFHDQAVHQHQPRQASLQGFSYGVQ